MLERSGWLARLRDERRIFLRVHDAVTFVTAPLPATEPQNGAARAAAGCVGELA